MTSPQPLISEGKSRPGLLNITARLTTHASNLNRILTSARGPIGNINSLKAKAPSNA